MIQNQHTFSHTDVVQLTRDIVHDKSDAEFKEGMLGVFCFRLVDANFCIVEFDTGNDDWCE